MNRSGLVQDEALWALTVSRALKELRSCHPKAVCDVASIDALSNLIDKKCDIRERSSAPLHCRPDLKYVENTLPYLVRNPRRKTY